MRDGGWAEELDQTNSEISSLLDDVEVFTQAYSEAIYEQGHAKKVSAECFSTMLY